MIFAVAGLAVGLSILAMGSNLFIDSSKSIARRLGVTELIIGLTLVSVGTSLPEFGASVYAAYHGSGAIAVGNIIGSNIANIALILGVSAVIYSIKTTRVMLQRDGYVMLGVSLLFAVLLIGGLSRLDGLILMVLFIIYMRVLYVQRGAKGAAPDNNISAMDGKYGEIIKLVIGGAGVLIGAKLLVDSAKEIALASGVSESVIGVTLVAFGTSVPELAVCMAAVRMKCGDIAIGNIIGSNIFNILWVGGVASLISPLPVDNVLLRLNVPIMIFAAAMLLIFMRAGWELKRWEGALFVALYVGFIFLNF